MDDEIRKIAIFVEGWTELLFVEKLLEELAGLHKVLIEKQQIKGGNKVPRHIVTVDAARPQTNERFFVLLVDCGGDHQVAGRIKEEHERLNNAGYQKIIGLRDIRPQFTAADVGKLEINMRKYIKTSLIPVQFVLAMLEIEAWFLAEHTHFERVDPSLGLDVVRNALGFDPSVENVGTRAVPSADLQTVYQLAGKSYAKPATDTIGALDFESVYVNVRPRVQELNSMLDSLDEFLT